MEEVSLKESVARTFMAMEAHMIWILRGGRRLDGVEVRKMIELMDPLCLYLTSR